MPGKHEGSLAWKRVTPRISDVEMSSTAYLDKRLDKCQPRSPCTQGERGGRDFVHMSLFEQLLIPLRLTTMVLSSIPMLDRSYAFGGAVEANPERWKRTSRSQFGRYDKRLPCPAGD